MNSKGHLFISLGKSAIRVIGGIVTLVNGSIIPLAVGIIVAEVGGVLEELVDEREEVRDLEDVSKIIREYFNEDLAYEMDKMIPEHTDEEYRDLEWQLEEKDGDITSLEDENDTLKNQIEILEDKIEELEEKLDKCK